MVNHNKKFHILSSFYENRFGWFRLCGIGVKWKDIKKHGLTFSERNGYSKGITIGVWRISYLQYNGI